MSRAVGGSRTFKLKMSPAGVELFLDCHHRLGCLVNELLPFGNTLYCALLYLDQIDAVLIVDDLQTLTISGLKGDRVCFVGAPTSLTDVIGRIIDRLEVVDCKLRLGALRTKLFIIALKRFRTAPSPAVLQAYDHMIEQAGDYLKVPRSKRQSAERIDQSP